MLTARSRETIAVLWKSGGAPTPAMGLAAQRGEWPAVDGARMLCCLYCLVAVLVSNACIRMPTCRFTIQYTLVLV